VNLEIFLAKIIDICYIQCVRIWLSGILISRRAKILNKTLPNCFHQHWHITLVS